MEITSIRQAFVHRVDESRDRLIALAAELTRSASENPPGDTTTIVQAIEDALHPTQTIEVRRVVGKHPVVNIIARLAGMKTGRRLIFNGHLDTFPVGVPQRWTVPPLGGTIADGRLYGRGASDMKAGLAASLLSVLLLAEVREHWRGEVVLTLVGDEETGGQWGTQYLLANVPEAMGDAMISGDAGSPSVLRFGEKGQVWLEVTATGQANHGAHVHLGVNAIERLMVALDRLLTLRSHECPIPDGVRAAIVVAASVSEAISGAGEAETLQRVTVNIGTIEGGSAVNIIPDRAVARLDIRMPVGVKVADILATAESLLCDLPWVSFTVLNACESNWTNPAHEIIGLARANSRTVLGREAVVNMRVGFSDARFYRQRGVPSLVYGPTPHNMGGSNEYVMLDDLFAVFAVHAMTAFDYLS